MSLNQLTQTMVARELSLNMEVNLMFRVMSLHQLMQTMVARELSLNVGARIFTELRRGDKRRKRPRNYTTLHCRAVSCITVRGNHNHVFVRCSLHYHPHGLNKTL